MSSPSVIQACVVITGYIEIQTRLHVRPVKTQISLRIRAG